MKLDDALSALRTVMAEMGWIDENNLEWIDTCTSHDEYRKAIKEAPRVGRPPKQKPAEEEE